VTTISEALAQVAQLIPPQIDDEMLAAPIPADEEQRLAALDELHLTGAPSPSLDRLAAKLARVFEVPLAFIAVVERHRQFFSGQSGLPAGLAATRQTPRNVSFGGHVIARNETMVIEDLARDRRFANNPFRREYGLRFSIGVPLHAPNGQPIGALCLMDTKPRPFAPRETRLLEEYAAEAEDELTRKIPLEAR
jgi:GAF domain-containing protein